MNLADLVQTYQNQQGQTLGDVNQPVDPNPVYRTDPQVLGGGGAAGRSAKMLKLYAIWREQYSSGQTTLQFEQWMANQSAPAGR